MERKQTSHPSMERIDDEMLKRVLDASQSVDFTRFTAANVQAALHSPSLSHEGFAALLSPAALPFLEDMAQKAKALTRRQFGNAVGLYTPLYLANYCVNECTYCGFNCKNHIHRATLTTEEIRAEFEAIARTGLREILLLTGEAPARASLTYIGEAVALAKEYFSTIGLEVYPMNTDDYAFLQRQGADFVSVYQETYDPVKYAEVHLSGPKRDFSYRFLAQERALLGGMRGVGVGALLGLGSFRQDAFAAGLHAQFLQQKYPHAEVSFSVPRLRPYVNHAEHHANDVRETQLLQVMLAYRLLLPFAGINISTRERAGFRDHVVGMVATRISAGVKTSVGGHEDAEKGDAQFEISDPRSVEEIRAMLREQSLQEVFTDYLRLSGDAP